MLVPQWLIRGAGVVGGAFFAIDQGTTHGSISALLLGIAVGVYCAFKN